MSGPGARRSLSVRALCWWLRAVARLLPAHQRARWHEEWDGELHTGAEARRLGVGRLSNLMIGMLRDALDVRGNASAAEARPGAVVADTRWTPSSVLDALRRDLWHAGRRLCRAPIVALGIVGTLALGIGANTAIFAVADTVLLKPLPYAHAERLFLIWEDGPQPTSHRTRISVPDFLDWRERASAFEAMGAYGETDLNVSTGDRVLRVEAEVVSSDFFRLLGVAPALGRDFEPREEPEGSGLSVVLSHRFWEREMGRDPAVVGRSLTVDGTGLTIAGVMPAHFRSPGGAALWIPLGNYGGNLRLWRATHVLTVIGRLAPDARVRAAEASMTDLAHQLWERNPIWNGWKISLRPLRTELYGDFRRAAAMMWVAGLSLLLVMCANLANLFLAEGTSRRPEFAVRRALGANRWALLTQRSVEIALLSGLAVAFGLLLALVMLKGLASSLPSVVTTVYPLTLDLRRVVYAVATAIGSAALFGLLPAAKLGAATLSDGVREGGRGGHGSGVAGLRATLVAGQLALAFALVVTTMLTAGSYQRVEQHLAATPGIDAVGMGSHVPFVRASPGNGASVYVVDRVREPGAEQPLVHVNRVSPGLLPTLGIGVTRGRPIEPADDAAAVPVALVNRAAAAMLWPDRDPLGAHIRTGVTGDSELLVVGVTEDVRLADLRRPASPQVFLAAAQFPPALQTFVIGAERPGEALMAAIRSAVAAVDSSLPIYDAAALRVYVDRSLASSVVSTRVLSALAVAAIALAAVGIYAVVTFTVGLRTHEFSVRRALGARPGDVLRLVLVEGVPVVGVGLAAGAAAAVLTARLISSQLFGISPLQPSAYLAAAAVLGFLALAAALTPALRAARVHPARALRGS